jgi:hypothetical protein
MITIEEAGRQAVKFVRKSLGLAEARVIKAAHSESGWNVEVEVYEESSFIKALGLPTRVRDRNVYLVSLDDQLSVQSYEREGTTA